MIHVLYHANCYDGFGAAWAAWRRINDAVLKFYPVNYGEPVPVTAGPDREKLYILDFSYPREALLKLAEQFDLVVLDHHKTARTDLEGLHFATFDLNKSGAVLAWEHFHPGEPVPLMLRYVQDRDLWRFELPGSREVAAWMRSWPFDFKTWDALARHHDGIHPITEGKAILRFQSRQVETMADNSVEIVIGGHKVHAANATLFFSEVGEALCLRYPDEPFAAYWLDRAGGKRQWGLRSRGGFDYSVVAEKYGGGGHPGAAGFTTLQDWRGA